MAIDSLQAVGFFAEFSYFTSNSLWSFSNRSLILYLHLSMLLTQKFILA